MTLDFELLNICSQFTESNLDWSLLKDDEEDTRFLVILKNMYFLLIINKVFTYKVWVHLKPKVGRPKKIVKEFPYERIKAEYLVVTVEANNLPECVNFLKNLKKFKLSKSRARFEIVKEPFNKFTDLVIEAVDDKFLKREYKYSFGYYFDLELKCELL
jgi:SpoVK/Ycf46/Vps4 family AAA+-type ATPase